MHRPLMSPHRLKTKTERRFFSHRRPTNEHHISTIDVLTETTEHQTAVANAWKVPVPELEDENFRSIGSSNEADEGIHVVSVAWSKMK